MGTLRFSIDWVSLNDKTEQSDPVTAWKEFLDQTWVTAAFAVNDYVASDIYKLTRQTKVRIPHDLSIVGFDNREFVEHLEVPLTTIAQDWRAIGTCAAELVRTQMADCASPASNVVKQLLYPVELVERRSCRKPTLTSADRYHSR